MDGVEFGPEEVRQMNRLAMVLKDKFPRIKSDIIKAKRLFAASGVHFVVDDHTATLISKQLNA